MKRTASELSLGHTASSGGPATQPEKLAASLFRSPNSPFTVEQSECSLASGCERGIGVLSNRARHDLSTSSRRTTGRPGMRRKMRSFVRKSEQLQEWPVAA